MDVRRVIGDDSAPYRTRAERLAVVASRFAADRDCWLATCDSDGIPHLVPLSFLADGPRFVLAHGRESPAARNVRSNPSVSLALGGFGDAVRATGSAQQVELDALGDELLARYVAKAGWEPRAPDHVGIVVALEEVRCSRSSEEDRDRLVWRAGVAVPW